MDRSRISLVLPVGLALLAAACAGGAPPSGEAAIGSPTASPVPVVPAATSAPAATAAPAPSDATYVPPSPSPSPDPLPSSLAPEIVAAIAWRRESGLRSDPAWVQQVAVDPTASESWAYPLLPDEEAFIWARQERLHQYVGLVQRYAAEHPEDYGGLYLDNANSRLATLWSANLGTHQAAIRALAGVDAPVVVLPVRWTEAELRGVQDRFDWQWAGFADVQAMPMGVGADLSRNLVSIDISSANPDAPQLIAQRLAASLGVPVEMLEVTSDGTGVELLPSGTVKGSVRLADGSRPGRNVLMVDGRADTIGYCGGGDIGYGVGENGRFEIPCKAGAYTIVIQGPSPTGEGWVVVGRAHVTVLADRVTTTRIRLVRGADVR